MGRWRVFPAWLGLVALPLAASASLVPACGPTDEGAGTGGAGGSSGGSATGGLGGTSMGGNEPGLNDPCSENGDRACDPRSSSLPLICSEGSWQSAGSCSSSQACEPSTGLCAEIVPACAGYAPSDQVCSAGAVVECGPNLVSVEVVEDCVGLCASTSAGSWCVPETCGDAVVDTGEACDDANSDSDDACTEYCRLPFCGDGFQQSDEVCDDANSNSDDECTELCAPPTCGDDFLQAGEDCDEGADNGAPGAYDCPIDCSIRVTQLALGAEFSCALHSSARVKCFGDGAFGQLGLEDTNDRGDQSGEMGSRLDEIDLGSGRFTLEIATGGAHACALLDDGAVRCWGDNSSGQLGLEDTDNRGDESGEMGSSLQDIDFGSGRFAKALAAGESHTCALLDDDSLKCWGENAAGQLGLGDTDNRGDDSGEMGSSLQDIDFGSGRFATALAAGARHTCALLDDGSLKCWGGNSSGQLGLEDTDNRGDDSGEMGSSLQDIDFGSGRLAVAIATGSAHTCALLDDDSLKCWGDNSSGQLGLGDTDHRGDDSGEMGSSLQDIDFGSGRLAVAIATGSAHTCALLDDDSLKCWGNNSSGQLGLGDTDHRGDDSGEMGSSLQDIDFGSGRIARALAAGASHTCALLDDESLKCWGENASGQLGLEDTDNRGDESGEMGSSLQDIDLW